MYCSHCGKPIDDAARFCSACGAAVQPVVFARGPVPGQLVRPRHQRVIAGVCAGFAQHYGWDLPLVRILATVALLISCGTVMLLYFVAWIVIPEEPYLLPERSSAGNPGTSI